MTPSTIRVATGPNLLVGDESRRASDLHYMDAGPRLKHGVLVVGARGPYLSTNLDGPAVGGDLLEHDGSAADERRRAGAQLGGRSQVAPGDRAEHPNRGRRHQAEHDQLDGEPASDERHDR